MDEAPPGSSGSESKLTPAVAPEPQGVGTRAGRLALWSPFVGLLALLILMPAVGVGYQGELRPMAGVVAAISCSIWLAGLVLAILLLRRTKRHGRRGVFGRALVGLGFDVLFLGAVAVVAKLDWDVRQMRDQGAEAEAERAAARYGTGERLQTQLALFAAQGFNAELGEVQRSYQRASAALTNPPVLGMATVRAKEALVVREEVIADFIQASQQLRDFCANAPEVYGDELLKHKLTRENRKKSLEQFTESIRRLNPTIIALRDADVRRGKAMLKIVRFERANWGKWQYRPESDELQFTEQRLAQQYRNLTHELAGLTAEAEGLQAKVKELTRTRN